MRLWEVGVTEVVRELDEKGEMQGDAVLGCDHELKIVALALSGNGGQEAVDTAKSQFMGLVRKEDEEEGISAEKVVDVYLHRLVDLGEVDVVCP